MTEKEFIFVIETAVNNSTEIGPGYIRGDVLKDNLSIVYGQLFPDGIFDREAELDNENKDND